MIIKGDLNMDFILHKINERIGFDDDNQAMLHQVRIEYLLNAVVAYLYGCNFNKISIEKKSSIVTSMSKPTIGSLIHYCEELDVDNELKKYNNMITFFSEYRDFRNTHLGHSFVFENGKSDIVEKLNDLYERLLKTECPIICDDVDIIQVKRKQNNIFVGLRYTSSGKISRWQCPVNSFDFVEEAFYFYMGVNNYYKITPFIHMEDYGDRLFLFKGIDSSKAWSVGKVKYNNMLKKEDFERLWPDFVNVQIAKDCDKILYPNGTTMNVYKKNYIKYIDIGIKKEIKKFLEKDRSSVCAILWGSGGIGKTATVQSICEDYANIEFKFFDFIFFLSAKNRRYDYYKGNIEKIDDAISTLEHIIEKINKIVFGDAKKKVDHFLNLKGKKSLIVIDDFETFPQEEKEKIEDFISQLDINNHKVIITTRSANINIGKEIKTGELSEEKTIEFLFGALENESITLTREDEKSLRSENARKFIYKSTAGRPLCIFQLATILAQKGVQDTLSLDISSSKNLHDFLYGLIYQWLSKKSQQIFVIVGKLLANVDGVVESVSKLMFVLDMEQQKAEFERAMDELQEQRVLKYDDDDHKFFSLYSRDIIEMMNRSYELEPKAMRDVWEERIKQLLPDNQSDIAQTLLTALKYDRVNKDEKEVVEKYESLLKRTDSSLELKFNMVSDYYSYLMGCDKRPSALAMLEKKSTHFINSNDKVVYTKFARLWSNANNSSGDEKEKEYAAQILKDFFKKHPFNEKSQTDIELLGSLLLIESKNLLNKKDVLDPKDVKDYALMIKKQYGEVLMNLVEQTKLQSWHTPSKQNVVIAMVSYVEILNLLQEKETCKHLCSLFTGIPNFMRSYFVKKMKSLDPDVAISENVVLANLEQEKKKKNPSATAIFVRNFPATFTEDDLAKLFVTYGKVKSTHIVRDPTTHRSKMFGFVEMEEKEAKENAIRDLNGIVIEGRSVTVEKNFKDET